MDPLVSDTLRMAAWSGCRNQAIAHAQHMGRLCYTDFRQLLVALADRLAPLPPPQNQEELDLRSRQVQAVAMLTGAIGHANPMSRLCPRAYPALLAEAKKLAETALPETEEALSAVQSRCSNFTITVSSICSRR